MKNTVQFAWLGVLAGIWLIVAPFFLSYNDRTATTNDIILGVIVIIISLVTLSSDRYLEGKINDNEE